MSKYINPAKIKLEASSICQLKCHSCPTAANKTLPTIGRGFLRLKNFKELININPQLTEIELSNYGEIFLNPDLLEIIKYAHEHNVALSAANGVNLNTVKEEVLEGLVKYQFRILSCSIDGASQESYEKYRVGGNFNVVIENIKRINYFKKKHHSPYPKLKWQFIAFGHNEHEIDSAKKLANELDMEFKLKLSWDKEFSPVQDKESIRKLIGAASRDEYKDRYGHDYMQALCHKLWDSPQINWDGKILGCSRNFWGDFGGNAFTDGLVKALNNEKIVYAREMLLGHNAARDDIPCTTCEIYLNMKQEGNYLRRPSWIQTNLLIPIKPFIKKLLLRSNLEKLLVKRGNNVYK